MEQHTPTQQPLSDGDLPKLSLDEVAEGSKVLTTSQAILPELTARFSDEFPLKSIDYAE